jgi:EAL domain-containing protein (putative c-di-GMP-specific phosphodiesterase class I)
VSASLSHVPASPVSPRTVIALSAAQAAAVSAAEAIAATAAAEVAAEAALTAQAAVDVAFEAAQTAAAKATDVAARAVLAAAAAAVEGLDDLPPAEQLTHVDGPAMAAAKVALRVRAVAAAASAAALEAAAVVAEQFAIDVAATAAAVAFASSHPALIGAASTDARIDEGTPTGRVSLAGRLPGSALDHEQRLLADELRRGIATDELQLHYQPIMDLASGRAVGVEALVRWQHPVRGLLAPQAFIDLAEQTELILPLGAWVLHEACRMAVSLQDRPGVLMTVAVNLSGRQLSDRGLVGTVRAALHAAGCSADRLVFEVTETALVTDMAAAVDSLRELQALGAGVAIDDFGTGYAPLTYLKQFAADDLKIDRSFVRGLGTDSYDTAIVASLISLAHNLNVRCVAEGVETAEQLTLLQQLGCDFAQGFLFSRPVDATSLGIWLDMHLTTGLPALPPTPTSTSQVPRILAMYQNGDSALTIAAALNAEGSHTVRGRRWSATSVTRTLGDALA